MTRPKYTEDQVTGALLAMGVAATLVPKNAQGEQDAWVGAAYLVLDHQTEAAVAYETAKQAQLELAECRRQCAEWMRQAVTYRSLAEMTGAWTSSQELRAAQERVRVVEAAYTEEAEKRLATDKVAAELKLEVAGLERQNVILDDCWCRIDDLNDDLTRAKILLERRVAELERQLDTPRCDSDPGLTAQVIDDLGRSVAVEGEDTDAS